MRCGLIVGIGGPELDAHERRLLCHPAVAGVILFARNYTDPDQLRQLTDALAGLRTPRLLVCVDQEGGRVQRFRDGFTRLPPPAVIGRWYRSRPDRARDLAYRHGRIMAAEVLGHGVDVSFAPVLDLDRGSRVIGERAFSDSPAAVADIGAWYVAGMRDAGMKCCGKHFPGHGSVAADSHEEIVTDARPAAALADDLEPFRKLGAALDAVMPAHVCYPDFDPQPAGFSARWLGRLRDECGFDGVIVSDDLDMAGAAGAGDVDRRLAAAASAGCELALVCRPDLARKLIEGLAPASVDAAHVQARAARLYGRAAFTLEEQRQVPEFRAWRASLDQLAGEHSG